MKSERQRDRRSVALEVITATVIATVSAVAADLLMKLL
jgi:hypothetical protein